LELAWGYGPSFEDIVADIPVPGEEGRYSTEMMRLGDDQYSVILRIVNYEDHDAQMFFKVRVTNEMGSRDFRITASNELPPADEVTGPQELETPRPDIESEEPMGAGTIVGIVVAVVVVLVAVLAAAYCKLNRLYCFGPKKDAEDKEVAAAGDTESTEAPPMKKRSAADLFSKLQTGLRKGRPQEVKEESEDDVTKSEEAPVPTPSTPPASKDAQV